MKMESGALIDGCLFICIYVFIGEAHVNLSSRGLFHICRYGNVYIECHMLYIMLHLWHLIRTTELPMFISFMLVFFTLC